MKDQKSKKIIKLSQTINDFEKNKEKLLALNKLKVKNKKLEKKLKTQNNNVFLTANKINNFIINLNSYQIVKDIDFNSNPTNNLELTFKLKGQFQKVYDFLKEIKYSYDTEELIIKKSDNQLNVFLILIFPLERADQ